MVGLSARCGISGHGPVGAITTPLAYESAGADFDPTRTYRYRLWRIWGGGSLTPWRTVLWVMLNPSTADETVLDPTLRRCERFSRSWGYDGFEVCNLFPLRSPDPSALVSHPLPGGPGCENDRAILASANRSERIVVGWGGHRLAQSAGRRLVQLLAEHGRTDIYCLKVNAADGSPAHPLYLPNASELRRYGEHVCQIHG